MTRAAEEHSHEITTEATLPTLLNTDNTPLPEIMHASSIHSSLLPNAPKSLQVNRQVDALIIQGGEQHNPCTSESLSQITAKLREHQGGWVNALAEHNLKCYQQLLSITLQAANIEQASHSESERLSIAQVHAAKLVVLFGHIDQARLYLERFKKQYPVSGKQLVHDACLFTLPDNIYWDVSLWQKIVQHHAPTQPNDLILRIIPFAAEIEIYVVNNREALLTTASKAITEEQRQQLSIEYDQRLEQLQIPQEAWILSQLQSLQHKIQKRIDITLQIYLKGQLAIPLSGRLSQEQITTLTERSHHLTLDDKQYADTIREELLAQYRQKIVARLDSERLRFSSSCKKTFIDTELAKMQRTIAMMATDRILWPSIPLDTLNIYLSHFCYARSQENPDAANLFFYHRLLETSFNLYLSLVPRDDSTTIPPLYIDGTDITPEYQAYYLAKISPTDPRAAILGKYTSCCQSLGDVGEECVLYGITDPRSGFYVLFKKNNAPSLAQDSIVAQCWAWRGQEDTVVFDSIETGIDAKVSETLVMDFFTLAAHRLVNEYNVSRVLVGDGGATPYLLGQIEPSSSITPLGYNGYLDSREQRILADISLPIVQLHLQDRAIQTALTPQHLAHSRKKELSSTEFMDWCDIAVINKLDESTLFYQQYLYPQAHHLGMTEETIQQRFSLTREWLAEEPSYRNLKFENRTLSDYLQSGVNVKLKNIQVSTFYIGLLHAYLRNSFIDDNILKLFINNPTVDINEQIKGSDISNKRTPLHYIIYNQKSQLSQIEFLLQHGALFDLPSMDGRVAILSAASAGRIDVLLLLEQYGADLNAKDLKGSNALHLAASNNAVAMLKYLVEERHFSVNSPNDSMATALHCAAKSVYGNSLGILQTERLQITQLLIEHGANMEAQDAQGETPLFSAIKANNAPVVKHLLSCGAQVTQRNTAGLLPADTLDILKSNHIDVITHLFLFGGQAPSQHQSWLLCIIEKTIECFEQRQIDAQHFLQLIRIFIEKGIDIEITNNNGLTALQLLNDLPSRIQTVTPRFIHNHVAYDNYVKLKNTVEKAITLLKPVDHITTLRSNTFEMSTASESVSRTEPITFITWVKQNPNSSISEYIKSKQLSVRDFFAQLSAKDYNGSYRNSITECLLNLIRDKTITSLKDVYLGLQHQIFNKLLSSEKQTDVYLAITLSHEVPTVFRDVIKLTVTAVVHNHRDAITEIYTAANRLTIIQYIKDKHMDRDCVYFLASFLQNKTTPVLYRYFAFAEQYEKNPGALEDFMSKLPTSEQAIFASSNHCDIAQAQHKIKQALIQLLTETQLLPTKERFHLTKACALFFQDYLRYQKNEIDNTVLFESLTKAFNTKTVKPIMDKHSELCQLLLDIAINILVIASVIGLVALTAYRSYQGFQHGFFINTQTSRQRMQQELGDAVRVLPELRNKL